MSSEKEEATEETVDLHTPYISLGNESKESPDDMLTLPQVAVLLGISESKAGKMSANKKLPLPITKFGTRVRVRQDDLRE